MKAWEIREGASQRIALVDRPSPAPAPEQVLIKVQATSLNHRDLILASGKSGQKNLQQCVALSDGAGEVAAVGPGVTRVKPGDRVAGCFFQTWLNGRFELRHHDSALGGPVDGMLAEYVVLRESGVVKIPPRLTFEEAACLPCAGLTAWYALITRGGMMAGETVLALGTGGVSIFALQLATAHGAKVIVTSSSDAKLARARELGAWQTVNYKNTPDWGKEVWRLTNKRGVDHVVEVGGAGTLDKSLSCVAAGGTIALIGVLTGFGPPQGSLFPLLTRNARIEGIYVGPRDDFEAMNHFLDQHGLRPVIDRSFPFAEAPAAYDYLASGAHFGKVVIRL